MARLQHAFTVDVEEWYDPIRFFRCTDSIAQARLMVGLGPLLHILEEHRIRATFFWVADTARRYPSVLKSLAEAGHEIGCHGLRHDSMIYEQTPEEFRAELSQALDIVSGLAGREVRSFRAPCFSITRRSLWAIDVLADLGICYDSSIFPVRNWRYGIPGFPSGPVRLGREGRIIEVPISVRRFMGMTIPTSGGAYFRIYPYIVTKANFLAAEAANQPVVFYLHPWELDPDHPRISFHWKAARTHYVNLRRSLPRVRRLVSEFSFTRLDAVAAKAAATAGRYES